MPSLSLLLLLVCPLLARPPVEEEECYCGQASRVEFGKTVDRIKGGVEAEVGEYPWQVVIHHPKNPDSDIFVSHPYCGGSIISDTWILTDRFCFNQAFTFVTLGEHNVNLTIEANDVIFNVEERIIHPSLSVGLIKLAEKIIWSDHPNIRPVCLPTRTDETYAGATTTMAGWGSYWDNGGPQENGLKYLKEVDMTVLTNKACKQAYAEPDTDPTANITDAIICAKGNGAPVLFGPGPCGFDEGNPLVVRNGPNYEQVGVYFSQYNCNIGPARFVRVTELLDWIHENMGSDNGTCPPSRGHVI